MPEDGVEWHGDVFDSSNQAARKFILAGYTWML